MDGGNNADAEEAWSDRISGNVNPQPRGGTLALLSGSNLVGDNRNPRVGMMSVLAFELVYFAGLTSNDLLGGVVSLLACLVLFNVMAKDSPNQ